MSVENKPPSTLDESHQNDIELQSPEVQTKQSIFKGLGILDRFLAVWIFLAMAVGIILGNFVPSTGPTLQRGTFVGVSVPIGKIIANYLQFGLMHKESCWTFGYDVSDTL